MSTTAAQSPNPAQLALALIILKSRPTQLPLEEHIANLRSVVVNRTRRTSLQSNQYIDGTSFWRQAYEKIELENNKLLNKVSNLEDILQRTTSPVTKTRPGPSKRSAANSVNKANTQSKRRKLETVPLFTDTEDILSTKAVSSDYHVLRRAFFNFRATFNDAESTNERLCLSLKCAAHAAAKVVSTNATSSSTAPVSQETTEGVFQIMSEVWLLSLNIIQKIDECKSKECSGCVPSLVYLFKSMLGCIQQYCLDEADKEIGLRRKARVKQHKSTTVQISSDNATSRTCRMVTRIISQVLAALDLEDVAHCILFEGLTCALLDHIGSSLSLLVFSERSIPIAKQKGILPPRGLLDVAHIGTDSAVTTTEIAAPYIISILQGIMSVADTLDDEAALHCSKLATWSVARPNSLLIDMKTRLQNTLLRGVYGEDDTTFKNTLTRSDEPDTMNLDEILASFQKEQKRSDWFIGQIWEHLGWDILVQY